MRKVFNVVSLRLSSKGVNDAIKRLEKKKKWLEDKANELVLALGNEGVYVSNLKFSKAEYDGTNDVKCEIKQLEDNKVAVIALGGTRDEPVELFIEFGTGIRYQGQQHPEAEKNGMIRGEFGRGRGKNPKGWNYLGEAGTHGKPIKGKENLVRTFGNPANMCMYLTIKDLERRFEEIVRRVFND